MTTFNQDVAQNAIIPSQKWQEILNFTSENYIFSLQFSTSFIPSLYVLGATTILTGDDTLDNSTVILPSARSGAVGNIAVIRNLSNNNVYFYANDGITTVLNIAPNQLYLLSLYKNDTTNGEWLTTQLGTGTSQAQASELAGYGLSALNSKLNSVVTTVDFNTPLTINNSYNASLLNWTGGSDTQSLPSSVMEGFYIYVKNSSPLNGIITFIAPPAKKIDGVSSLSLSYNQSCILITDINSNWYTVGLGDLATATGVQLSSEGIKVVAGSVTTPSYSFIDYPSTGFFAGSSNSIDVAIQGTEVVRINPNGINIESGELLWDGIPLMYFTNLYP